MNLLLISASPRREQSKTFMLALEMVKGLDPSVKTEIMHLCGQRIEFCRECEQCHANIMQCPLKDDAAHILRKMLNADGIILASPNYINMVTASMKALFDRSSHFIHCMRLKDKYFAGVVTSGSGRNREVLDYMAHYANTCGAQFAAEVSSQPMIGEKQKREARTAGRTFFKAINEKRNFPSQANKMKKAKAHFKRIMEIRKHSWQGEYQYWKDKGWI